MASTQTRPSAKRPSPTPAVPVPRVAVMSAVSMRILFRDAMENLNVTKLRDSGFTQEDWNLTDILAAIREREGFHAELEDTLTAIHDTFIKARDLFFQKANTSVEEQVEISSIFASLYSSKKGDEEEVQPKRKAKSKWRSDEEEDDEGEDDDEPVRRPKSAKKAGSPKSAGPIEDAPLNVFRIRQLDLSHGSYSSSSRRVSAMTLGMAYHYGTPWFLGPEPLKFFKETFSLDGVDKSKLVKLLGRPLLTPEFVFDLYAGKLTGLVDTPSRGVAFLLEKGISLDTYCLLPQIDDLDSQDIEVTGWVNGRTSEVAFHSPVIHMSLNAPAWLTALIATERMDSSHNKNKIASILDVARSRAYLAESRKSLSAWHGSIHQDLHDSLSYLASSAFRKQAAALRAGQEHLVPGTFADRVPLSACLKDSTWLDAAHIGLNKCIGVMQDGEISFHRAWIEYLRLIKAELKPRKGEDGQVSGTELYAEMESSAFLTQVNHVVTALLHGTRDVSECPTFVSVREGAEAPDRLISAKDQYPYLNAPLASFIFNFQSTERPRSLSGEIRKEPTFLDLWTKSVSLQINTEYKSTTTQIEVLARRIAALRLSAIRLKDVVDVIDKASAERVGSMKDSLLRLPGVKEVLDENRTLIVETHNLFWTYKENDHREDKPVALGPIRILFTVSGSMFFQTKKVGQTYPVPNAFGWESVCLGSFQESITTALGQGDFARAAMYFLNWATMETDSYGRGHASEMHKISESRFKTAPWSANIPLVVLGNDRDLSGSEDDDEDD